MLTFLHAADIHLDSPLRGLSHYEGAPPIEEIRGATRQALDNLVNFALEEKINFVLVAGDLYDGDWQDFNTGLYFANQMRNLGEAGIRVAIIRGNHDAANTMTKTIPMPQNVKIFSERKLETWQLKDIGVAIHGQSEKRATAKIKLTDKLDTANERLAELASGQNLQEFVEQVKAHDPDELVAKLERLDVEKQEALHKQKFIVQEIALANKELQSIGGESLAAAIAEEAEGLVGKIQTDVEYYVKLRLASAILTKAMERYRQSNQSPVLSIASNYFKIMTQGSFAGLRADFDDKGDPVIKAKRPDEKMLTLAEMSDGSRDQLFLALRLGGLARYVKANGPMPFIVDDVLVHFDDARSAAALAALGELAKETQVVFFTHHKHLISLAESAVSDKILCVHEL